MLTINHHVQFILSKRWFVISRKQIVRLLKLGMEYDRLWRRHTVLVDNQDMSFVVKFRE
jgi:hypothetical protein